MKMRDTLGIRRSTFTPFVKNTTRYEVTIKDIEIQDNPWDKDILIYRLYPNGLVVVIVRFEAQG